MLFVMYCRCKADNFLSYFHLIRVKIKSIAYYNGNAYLKKLTEHRCFPKLIQCKANRHLMANKCKYRSNCSIGIVQTICVVLCLLPIPPIEMVVAMFLKPFIWIYVLNVCLSTEGAVLR